MHNLRTTWLKVRHRWQTRKGTNQALPWGRWVWYALIALAAAALILDEPVGAHFNQWSPRLSAIAEVITRAGLSGWYLGAAVAVAMVFNLADWSRLRGRRLLRAYNWTMLALFVLVSTGLGGILVTVIKQIVGRARPGLFAELGRAYFQPFTWGTDFESFPSGHSTTVGSIAMAIVLLVPQSRVIVVPVAVAIASSRIVLGSHYPSDVVAGLALGGATTLVTALVFARLGYLFRQRSDGLPVRRKSFRLGL